MTAWWRQGPMFARLLFVATSEASWTFLLFSTIRTLPFCWFDFAHIMLHLPQCSGGGASHSAAAFCLCRPGSNPGTDLAFLVQNLQFIYSHWASGFVQERAKEWCTLLFLLSNFLSTFKIVNLSIVIFQWTAKRKIYQKMLHLPQGAQLSFTFLRKIRSASLP